MKEIFELYAVYNKKADESMMNILKKLPGDLLRKDMGAYFKSILDTLEHMILMNIMWLKRTNGLFQNKYASITNSAVMNLSDMDIKDRIKKDYAYAFALKSEMDELFDKYVHELKEDDFNKRLRYKNIKGEELERTYWHTIIHIFNHETHHRGAISAMLDQLKIDNDYSGVQLYVK